ncbi:MAG: head GIN domain-containing protein [Bacteroidales bacterium]
MKAQVKISLLSLMIWILMVPLTSQGQKIIREPRTCMPFSRIVNHSSADLIIQQGTQNEIVVEADQAIIDRVITEVKGNTLNIFVQIPRPFRKTNIIKVRITVPALEELVINGSGDISTEQALLTGNMKLTVDGSGDARIAMQGGSFECHINGSGDVSVNGARGDLQLNIHGSGDFTGTHLQLNTATLSCFGSGDIRLEGKAAQLNIDNSASGDMNATELPTEKVVIQSKGSGDVKVWAIQSIQAKLLGSGDVTVKGNPKNRQISKKGSGNIHFL